MIDAIIKYTATDFRVKALVFGKGSQVFGRYIYPQFFDLQEICDFPGQTIAQAYVSKSYKTSVM
jgi:hypothetical protein